MIPPGVAWIVIACCALTILASQGLATEIRFNCGGNAYTRFDGREYLEDDAYPGTMGAGYSGGSTWESELLPGGTSDHTLYRFARRGEFEYRFDVPDGPYLLELAFSEIRVHSHGLRAQDVLVDGQVVLDSLDIARHAWKDYALDFLLPVEVMGGTIEVGFDSYAGLHEEDALVAGVGLISRDPDLIAPASPTNVEAIGGYRRNILSWSRPSDDDVAGYRVYRATTSGGPYDLVAPEYALLERCYDDSVVTNGPTYYYRVSAVDAYGNESAMSSERSAVPVEPTATAHQRFELTVDPDSLLDLYTHPKIDDLTDASLLLDNVPFDSVQIRFRGGFSRKFSKKSWRIQIPIGQETWKINLNGEAAETSLKREYVVYELFRDLLLPTPLTNWAHLNVNDVFMGVFLSVERIGKSFLERTELDNGSSIYKCKGNLSVLGTVEEYMEDYEKETNEYLPHDDLIDLITMINQAPADSFPQLIAQAIDLHEYFTWYSGIIATGGVDFTNGNYYLVHDLDWDRWRILPWDQDLSMGITFPYDRWYENCETAIDQGTVEHPGIQGGPNYLIDRLLSFPQFQWMHAEYLRNALDTVFLSELLDPRIDAAHSAITYDAYRDVFKFGWEKHTWFDYSPSDLKNYVTCRRAYLLEELESYTPAISYPFRLNEFMADNDTTLADEHGEFDDWVEIMNVSGSPASLAGYHLSDGMDHPYDWALPDTVLPASGFLVVWADDSTGQGPLHAPFKLSAPGEELVLSAPVEDGGVVVDHFRCGAQATDVSMGRLPNGTGPWVVQEEPSPGEANGDGPISVDDPVSLIVPARPVDAVPNPHQGSVRFELAKGLAELQPGDPSSSGELHIYDSAGRLIRTLELKDATGIWDGRDSGGRTAAAGVYFYELRTAAFHYAGKLVRIK